MPGPPPEHPNIHISAYSKATPASAAPASRLRRGALMSVRGLRRNRAKEEWRAVAPELHRLGLLTVLDVGPFAAYCSAAARLRLAEEAIERMAKLEPSGHALTVERSAGDRVTNPLLRIASQAKVDCSTLVLSSA